MCPGTVKCSETDGLPLKSYEGSDQDQESICGGCTLKATKTDNRGINAQIENFLTSSGEQQTTNLFAVQPSEDEKKTPALVFNSKYTNAAQIIEAIYECFEVMEIESTGATFVYPNSLSSFQWNCLKAYSSGKTRAETEKHEREKDKK